MVEIKGLEKFGPKDFPGHISSTVFLGGCNFRCPFCHNPELVLEPEKLPSFPPDYFSTFLDSRKGWQEAVCFTGGEPLLNEDLDVLLHLVKERGLLVKLDTNGSFPKRLKRLIQEKLVDYVAMDVKAPLQRYREVTGVKVDTGKLAESIDIIRDSAPDYVFRTTVVPDLLTKKDILKVAELLKGASRYQLQQFLPGKTIDSRYDSMDPYNREELENILEAVRPFFSQVVLEGV
ncbi:MAG: anaerobic ribonucleoside-triphosphate reductase activating protein [Candidatus Aminicenantes bacterium]|nr:anaerobic ribonucleoside-triphosphate reductase activating protein [Candidatus Aminicenantes bacterium]